MSRQRIAMYSCDYAECTTCHAKYTRTATPEGNRAFSRVLSSHERTTGHKYFIWRLFANPEGETFADKIAIAKEAREAGKRMRSPSYGGNKL